MYSHKSILGIGVVVLQREAATNKTSIEVDFQKSRITMHTIDGKRDSVITKIEFNDVLPICLKHSYGGSIILTLAH
ncbi:hypothetical protein D3C73_1084760 [compost metagenome]